MNRIRKIVAISLTLLFVLTGCSKPSENEKTGASTNKDTPIVIGSKDFTESILASELYAQALKKAGYTVELKQALGGTPILHQAMLSDEIDIIAEYTSSGIAMVLQEDAVFDKQAAYTKVSEGYLEKFNLVWLNMSEVNNSQGLAVTKTLSDEYSFTKISQLPEIAPHVRLCATAEFEEREDGLKGLKTALGEIDFASIRVYDKSLKYEILRQGEADMNICFTTDADLAVGDIIALEDDISFWPPYNLAPVARGEILEKYPEVAEILNLVTSHMTTDVMQNLNAKVDIDKGEYDEVAKQALTDWGVLT